MLPTGGCAPRPRQELAYWGQRLAVAASALLNHWTSGRLERAALRYALVWDGTSELARQVDRAFEYYLAWLEEVSEIFNNQATSGTTSAAAATQGFGLLRETLEGLLEELRSRVQYLQTRAADIRISGKLQEVAGALLDLELDRVADGIVAAIRAQASTAAAQAQEDLAAQLAHIESSHPEVQRASERDLQRLGERVEQRARSANFDLAGWLRGGGLQTVRQFAGSVAAGVAGNAAYAWLVHVLAR